MVARARRHMTPNAGNAYSLAPTFGSGVSNLLSRVEMSDYYLYCYAHRCSCAHCSYRRTGACIISAACHCTNTPPSSNPPLPIPIALFGTWGIFYAPSFIFRLNLIPGKRINAGIDLRPPRREIIESGRWSSIG